MRPEHIPKHNAEQQRQDAARNPNGDFRSASHAVILAADSASCVVEIKRL
jgi:hypothetical protein